MDEVKQVDQQNNAQQVIYPLDYTSKEIIRSQSEAFPVYSVFLCVTPTDPAVLLGYGTWTQFGGGRMLVGQTDDDPDFEEAEQTGGSKTHTLNLTEIPSHNHPGVVANDPTGNVGYALGSSANTDGESGYAGGGQPHNNMSPYIVVYMWKRIA